MVKVIHEIVAPFEKAEVAIISKFFNEANLTLDSSASIVDGLHYVSERLKVAFELSYPYAIDIIKLSQARVSEDILQKLRHLYEKFLVKLRNGGCWYLDQSSMCIADGAEVSEKLMADLKYLVDFCREFKEWQRDFLSLTSQKSLPLTKSQQLQELCENFLLDALPAIKPIEDLLRHEALYPYIEVSSLKLKEDQLLELENPSKAIGVLVALANVLGKKGIIIPHLQNHPILLAIDNELPGRQETSISDVRKDIDLVLNLRRDSMQRAAHYVKYFAEFYAEKGSFNYELKLFEQIVFDIDAVCQERQIIPRVEKEVLQKQCQAAKLYLVLLLQAEHYQEAGRWDYIFNDPLLKKTQDAIIEQRQKILLEGSETVVSRLQNTTDSKLLKEFLPAEGGQAIRKSCLKLILGKDEGEQAEQILESLSKDIMIRCEPLLSDVRRKQLLKIGVWEALHLLLDDIDTGAVVLDLFQYYLIRSAVEAFEKSSTAYTSKHIVQILKACFVVNIEIGNHLLSPYKNIEDLYDKAVKIFCISHELELTAYAKEQAARGKLEELYFQFQQSSAAEKFKHALECQAFYEKHVISHLSFARSLDAKIAAKNGEAMIIASSATIEKYLELIEEAIRAKKSITEIRQDFYILKQISSIHNEYFYAQPQIPNYSIRYQHINSVFEQGFIFRVCRKSRVTAAKIWAKALSGLKDSVMEGVVHTGLVHYITPFWVKAQESLWEKYLLEPGKEKSTAMSEAEIISLAARATSFHDHVGAIPISLQNSLEKILLHCPVHLRQLFVIPARGRSDEGEILALKSLFKNLYQLDKAKKQFKIDGKYLVLLPKELATVSAELSLASDALDYFCELASTQLAVGKSKSEWRQAQQYLLTKNKQLREEIKLIVEAMICYLEIAVIEKLASNFYDPIDFLHDMLCREGLLESRGNSPMTVTRMNSSYLLEGEDDKRGFDSCFCQFIAIILKHGDSKQCQSLWKIYEREPWHQKLRLERVSCDGKSQHLILPIAFDANRIKKTKAKSLPVLLNFLTVASAILVKLNIYSYRIQYVSFNIEDVNSDNYKLALEAMAELAQLCDLIEGNSKIKGWLTRKDFSELPYQDRAMLINAIRHAKAAAREGLLVIKNFFEAQLKNHGCIPFIDNVSIKAFDCVQRLAIHAPFSDMLIAEALAFLIAKHFKEQLVDHFKSYRLESNEINIEKVKRLIDFCQSYDHLRAETYSVFSTFFKTAIKMRKPSLLIEEDRVKPLFNLKEQKEGICQQWLLSFGNIYNDPSLYESLGLAKEINAHNADQWLSMGQISAKRLEAVLEANGARGYQIACAIKQILAAPGEFKQSDQKGGLHRFYINSFDKNIKGCRTYQELLEFLPSFFSYGLWSQTSGFNIRTYHVLEWLQDDDAEQCMLNFCASYSGSDDETYHEIFLGWLDLYQDTFKSHLLLKIACKRLEYLFNKSKCFSILINRLLYVNETEKTNLDLDIAINKDCEIINKALNIPSLTMELQSLWEYLLTDENILKALSNADIQQNVVALLRANKLFKVSLESRIRILVCLFQYLNLSLFQEKSIFQAWCKALSEFIKILQKSDDECSKDQVSKEIDIGLDNYRIALDKLLAILPIQEKQLYEESYFKLTLGIARIEKRIMAYKDQVSKSNYNDALLNREIISSVFLNSGSEFLVMLRGWLEEVIADSSPGGHIKRGFLKRLILSMIACSQRCFCFSELMGLLIRLSYEDENNETPLIDPSLQLDQIVTHLKASQHDVDAIDQGFKCGIVLLVEDMKYDRLKGAYSLNNAISLINIGYRLIENSASFKQLQENREVERTVYGLIFNRDYLRSYLLKPKSEILQQADAPYLKFINSILEEKNCFEDMPSLRVGLQEAISLSVLLRVRIFVTNADLSGLQEYLANNSYVSKVLANMSEDELCYLYELNILAKISGKSSRAYQILSESRWNPAAQYLLQYLKPSDFVRRHYQAQRALWLSQYLCGVESSAEMETINKSDILEAINGSQQFEELFGENIDLVLSAYNTAFLSSERQYNDNLSAKLLLAMVEDKSLARKLENAGLDKSNPALKSFILWRKSSEALEKNTVSNFHTLISKIRSRDLANQYNQNVKAIVQSSAAILHGCAYQETAKIMHLSNKISDRKINEKIEVFASTVFNLNRDGNKVTSPQRCFKDQRETWLHHSNLIHILINAAVSSDNLCHEFFDDLVAMTEALPDVYIDEDDTFEINDEKLGLKAKLNRITKKREHFHNIYRKVKEFVDSIFEDRPLSVSKYLDFFYGSPSEVSVINREDFLLLLEYLDEPQRKELSNKLLYFIHQIKQESLSPSIIEHFRRLERALAPKEHFYENVKVRRFLDLKFAEELLELVPPCFEVNVVCAGTIEKTIKGCEEAQEKFKQSLKCSSGSNTTLIKKNLHKLDIRLFDLRQTLASSNSSEHVNKLVSEAICSGQEVKGFKHIIEKLPQEHLASKAYFQLAAMSEKQQRQSKIKAGQLLEALAKDSSITAYPETLIQSFLNLTLTDVKYLIAYLDDQSRRQLIQACQKLGGFLAKGVLANVYAGIGEFAELLARRQAFLHSTDELLSDKFISLHKLCAGLKAYFDYKEAYSCAIKEAQRKFDLLVESLGLTVFAVGHEELAKHLSNINLHEIQLLLAYLDNDTRSRFCQKCEALPALDEHQNPSPVLDVLRQLACLMAREKFFSRSPTELTPGAFIASYANISLLKSFYACKNEASASCGDDKWRAKAFVSCQGFAAEHRLAPRLFIPYGTFWSSYYKEISHNPGNLSYLEESGELCQGAADNMGYCLGKT